MNSSIRGMNILADNSIDQQFNVSDLPLYIKTNGRLSDFSGKKNVPHWNSGLETIYIRNGSMNIVANGQPCFVKESDLCIILPGCVHYFENINDGDCTYDCHVVDESLFRSGGQITNQYLAPIFHSFCPNILIISSAQDGHAELISMAEQISVLYQAPSESFELIMISLFYQYLSCIHKAVNSSLFASDKPVTKTGDTMCRILSYIHQNYSQSISTALLCEIGMVSRNQCFSIFRQYTGDTPANYILKYRLYVSRSLLIHSDLPISQIATDCGFTHQSHYTNHFSSFYGVTPLQYRKSHQK